MSEEQIDAVERLFLSHIPASAAARRRAAGIARGVCKAPDFATDVGGEGSTEPRFADRALGPIAVVIRIGTLFRTVGTAPENLHRLVVVLEIEPSMAPDSFKIRQITGEPFRLQGADAVEVWCSPTKLQRIETDEPPPLRPRIKAEVRAYQPTPEVLRMLARNKP